MNIRKIIRVLVPRFILTAVGSRIIEGRAHRLAKLPIAEAFDLIYKKRMWQQGESLSGPGSEGRWASDYVTFVGQYIRDNGITSVLDVGCGDFEVGSKLAPLVEEYIAVDISKHIIEVNRAKYAAMTNVTFGTLNLIEHPLPSAELILVRQVLQHLNNTQIEAALQNIGGSAARAVLITEHTHRPENMAEPNVDLGAHSVATRVMKKSGIDIGLPPFSRRRTVLAMLEPGRENAAESGSVLAIYELRPPFTS
jgi:SAM-dependent methyltransferase